MFHANKGKKTLLEDVELKHCSLTCYHERSLLCCRNKLPPGILSINLSNKGERHFGAQSVAHSMGLEITVFMCAEPQTKATAKATLRD